MVVFTIRSKSLVAPIAEAVILSAPPTVAVTFTITWPLAFVTEVAALRVLPFAEVTVTVLPAMPSPAESFRKIVSGVESPNDRDAAPLIDRFVPVTVTVLVAALTQPVERSGESRGLSDLRRCPGSPSPFRWHRSSPGDRQHTGIGAEGNLFIR